MTPVASAEGRRLGILVSSDDSAEVRFAVHGQPFLVPLSPTVLLGYARLGGLFSVLVGHDEAGQLVVKDALPTEDGYAHGG